MSSIPWSRHAMPVTAGMTLRSASVAAALLLTAIHADAQELPATVEPRSPATATVPANVQMATSRASNDEWKKGDPIPAGYHAESSIRNRPFVAGVAFLGLFYSFTAIAAGVVGRHAAALWVPVAGPFIQFGVDPSNVANPIILLDGFMQSFCVGSILYGLASRKTVLVRNDLALRIAPTPMTFGRSGGGVGLAGTF